ncbi:hypothetical protein ES708_14250 [subsurface metagenome]
MEKVGSPELLAELLVKVEDDGFMPEPQTWNRDVVDLLARQERLEHLSESNLKRLQFIKQLIRKGLNLAAVKHYLGLYPCWFRGACPVYMNRPDKVDCAKRCWKEKGTYCQVPLDKPNPCSTCQLRDLECPVEEPVANLAGVGLEEEVSNSEHP